jgi:hypothetical protein
MHARSEQRGGKPVWSSSVVSIFDDFEQIASLDIGHRVEQKVVEHEQVNSRELAKQ